MTILIFRVYQEQEERQMELKQQYDRIENQLRFENENDTESKFLNYIFVNIQVLSPIITVFIYVYVRILCEKVMY